MGIKFNPLLQSGFDNTGSGGGGSGVNSLTNVGSAPNAQAGTISGTLLTLQPADGTNPGALTAIAQNIGGNKTFLGDIIINGSTTLNSSLNGPIRASSGLISTGSISLITEVSGILPIINGGTNSSSALNNNRFIISSGGAIVEQSALTANRAVQTDGSGLPAVSTTTSTELGYVSGVTSAIQTQIDGKVSKSGDTMTGFLILNANPVSALGAATKQYVDGVASGLSIKSPVLVATTADITLSGEQTIDGVLTSSSRVLVKNQATASENGIYVSAAGPWSRSSDANTGPLLEEAFVFVEEGSTQADTGWVNITNPPITIGVTDINFVQFSGAGTYTADGQGVKLSGTQFFLSLDGTTLSQSASGVKVATGGITNNEVAAAAAIARSKIANGTANQVVVNDSLGALSSEAQLAISRGGTNSGAALNNNRLMVSSGGAIVEEAAITVNRALASNTSGLPIASATTDTELGYLSGVTSSVQTQLNNKANIALDNLSSVAINTSLLPGSDNSINLGSASFRWANNHALNQLLYGSTSGAITLKAADTTTSYSIKFPSSQGTANAVLTNDGSGNLTWIVPSGTVSSVAFSADPIFTVSGSPITTSGTITLGLANENANTVWAGPATGSPATPTFRSLVSADIPLISLTSGVSGVLPIANGGTNSSTSLNNNRIMVSSGGAVVEEAAITANRALASNSNGLPVASATTDTELGYVSGVTSSIQTQLNGKMASFNWNKEDITLSGTDITNQYVDLAFLTKSYSLFLFVDGVSQVEGDDYLLSNPGAVTRLTFNNGLATGGVSELVAGDILHLEYSY